MRRDATQARSRPQVQIRLEVLPGKAPGAGGDGFGRALSDDLAAALAALAVLRM